MIRLLPALLLLAASSTAQRQAAPTPSPELGAGVPGSGPGHLFVDAAATGVADGSSWADAYPDLSDALDVARGGTRIFVAGGTYRPDRGTGNPSLHFEIRSDVELLGGFAGTAGSRPFAHDPALFPTVLSGDLLGDDGPGFTNRADNSIGVAWIGGGAPAHPGRVVDVSFRGSEGSSAVYVYGSSRFLRCRFEDSRAVYRGGGLYAVADVRLVDCVVQGNRVDIDTNFGSNPGGGGGVAVGSFSGGVAARFVRCTLSANRVEVLDPTGYEKRGGGLLFASTLPAQDRLELVDCAFLGNTLAGAGVALGGGLDTQATSDLLRCDFVGNRIENPSASTSRGAGLNSGEVSFGSPSNATRMVSCRLLGNAIDADLGPGAVSVVELAGGGAWVAGGTLWNVLAAGNRLDLLNPGGALGRTVTGSGVAGDSLTLRGATIAHNGLTSVGSVGIFGGPVGGGFATDGTSTAVNTILWSNDTAGSTTEEDQVRVFGAGSLAIDSSCLQGLTGGLGGVGNVGSDPLFADPDGADDTLGTLDDDYRLGALSPVADAGDDAGIGVDALDADGDGDRSETLPLDLLGRTRQQENAQVPNTGSGAAPLVDMGALEGPG